ncbi:transposase [Escherichia coli]
MRNRRTLRSRRQASEAEGITTGEEKESFTARVLVCRAVTYEVNGVEKTVLISLPADRYKAKEVAEVYHSRWEIEIGFRNLKSSLLNNALAQRSRKVELVEQEVWGILLAYNLI